MIISREYTVQAKTALLSFQSDVIMCPAGTLTKVRFISAMGVNYEVYARIVHFENSIIPNETGEWLALAGMVQEFTPNWNSWSKVPSLTVELCSPDARFQHTIQLELEIEEKLTLQQLFTSLLQGIRR